MTTPRSWRFVATDPCADFDALVYVVRQELDSNVFDDRRHLPRVW